MKKILSAVLAAATLSTAAPALAAEGGSWYAGLQLGAAFNRQKITTTRVSTSQTTTKSKVSAPFGLQMGWMYGMPSNFFFAAEVGAYYDLSGDASVTHTIAATNYTSKLTKRWGLEFMPKFGYQFNNDWAAYVLLGITGTSFKLSAPAGNTTKFVGGIAPGLGAMYKVDSQWSTNLEYKYQIHQKVEKTGTVGGVSVGSKAEPRAHVITAKVNYHFA